MRRVSGAMLAAMTILRRPRGVRAGAAGGTRAAGPRQRVAGCHGDLARDCRGPESHVSNLRPEAQAIRLAAGDIPGSARRRS